MALTCAARANHATMPAIHAQARSVSRYGFLYLRSILTSRPIGMVHQLSLTQKGDRAPSPKAATTPGLARLRRSSVWRSSGGRGAAHGAGRGFSGSLPAPSRAGPPVAP
jgi:hypothetical protein